MKVLVLVWHSWMFSPDLGVGSLPEAPCCLSVISVHYSARLSLCAGGVLGLVRQTEVPLLQSRFVFQHLKSSIVPRESLSPPCIVI